MCTVKKDKIEILLLSALRIQNGPGAFTGTSCNPCTFGENPTGAIAGGTISYFAAVATTTRSWGRLKVLYR